MHSISDPARPGVEEDYTSATNTSNLTVKAEKRGAGDMLIAAGWSKSRLGAALMRLRSEWDHSSHPQKPVEARIKALAGTLATDEDGLVMTPAGSVRPITAARAMAAEWHLHELGLMFQNLKTLPAVREQLGIKGRLWLIEDIENKAASTLRWWLDQTCPTCDGVRWQVIPGSGRLSDRPCPACGGSGLAQVPAGRDGRRLAGYMDECVDAARASIKVRLHAMRTRG